MHVSVWEAHISFRAIVGLPRSDVKRLPDMAEIIFCGAVISSSLLPLPLFGG